MGTWRNAEEDALSEKGANSLARKIQTYWWKRGVSVAVWVEPGKHLKASGGPSFWCVRSNIQIATTRDPNPGLR
jgi:hypothetical protein